MQKPEPGHETRDVNVRKVTIFGIGLMAVVLIAALLMVKVFDILAAREAGRQGEPTTLTARPAAQLPPEPRLLAEPVKALAEMRAEEEPLLDTYGWVDRQAGVARIPVDEAMEIVVQRGLK